MRVFVILFVRLIATPARLQVRAASILSWLSRCSSKYQLLILNRSRKRAPNLLRVGSDRRWFVCPAHASDARPPFRHRVETPLLNFHHIVKERKTIMHAENRNKIARSKTTS
jgi:hypothetical protein